LEKNILERYRHPVLFYVLSFMIPWILWFIAAYVSHIESRSYFHVIVFSTLGMIGLVSPVIIAFMLMMPDAVLWKDFKSRLFNFRAIKARYAIMTCLIMLVSILTAQVISLFFGYSPSQFSFSQNFSFTGGIFSAWFLLLIAPILEELAWHSYGTDTLRRRLNLFNTSMIFAFFWGLWHLPLSFIKDYYQSNVAASGLLYSLNFIVSLFPFVILMNWLYFKTGRNILVVIVFHISAGFFNEIFATHPMSKVIQTGLLLILSIAILYKERSLFFKLDYVM